MTISLAKKSDALAIARIHKTQISGGFLSSLPEAFLQTFYLALIESSASFCVVAKEDETVIGFISAATDVSAFYRYFLRHYFFSSAFMLLPKVFSSPKRIMETLLYPKKEQSLPKAELLTIAVSAKFQGRGIGTQLFAIFVTEMKQRGASQVKVLVGENLKPAIAFYEKSGFTFVKNISVHGAAVSKIYVLAL